MPPGGGDPVKDPNHDPSIVVSTPLEQRPARQRIRDSIGTIRSSSSQSSSSSRRSTRSSRSLIANPIESYLLSPSGIRSKGVTKKATKNTLTGKKSDNPNPTSHPDPGTYSDTTNSSPSITAITTSVTTMSAAKMPPFLRTKAVTINIQLFSHLV